MTSKILLFTTAAVLSSCTPGSDGSAPPAFDGWTESSAYITSEDGTRLAISIRRPTVDGEPYGGTLPVIVTQDRSGLRPESLQRMKRFSQNGYVWIAQDRRGTGASFGTQTGFVNQDDARDAKSVIEWAARQDFSNGKTVALGCSNQGAWQYLVATLQPESLVAIAPSCASPQFFDDAVAINGIPMIPLGLEPYDGACTPGSTGARPGNAPPPQAEAVDSDEDGVLLAAALEEQECGASMLGQYWLNMPRDGYNAFAGNRPALDDSAMTRWTQIKDSGIAIFQIGGWFDAAVAGQIEGQDVLGGRLLMGPWTHGNRVPRGADFPKADYAIDDEILKFFDANAQTPAKGTFEDGVTYYTVNAAPGDEWRSAPSFPDYSKAAYFLTPDGGLTTQRTANDSAITYSPEPVTWFDGRYSPLARWWDGDFSAQNDASLLITSAALEVPTEITGTITAELWVSTDKPDANVFVMLQDVSPDGDVTYMTDGRIRASWRKIDDLPWENARRTWHGGYEDDIEPLEAGVPTQLIFDFFPISYVVPEGHRLQFALSTSIGNEYQEPPLNSSPVENITIYTDDEHPSNFRIPVAP